MNSILFKVNEIRTNVNLNLFFKKYFLEIYDHNFDYSLSLVVCPYPERYNDVNKDPISSGMGHQYSTVKAIFATIF